MALKIQKHRHQIIIAIITMLIINNSMAQRPSFAGSRPPGGLNQKDKYHTTSTQSSADIANRFGGSDTSTLSNQIPFGQPQNPPIGYPVVVPESVYVALIPPLRPTAGGTNTAAGGVVFEDRFGDIDTNAVPAVSAGVPLDAHGDQLLIDQLNQLPLDKRPFWFINYQAIESQRNGTANNSAGAQASRGSFFG